MPIKLKTPGSKSIANRALILNFLTGNKTELKNLPDCDDTKYMIEGIKKLNNKNKTVKIHTGNAGTATRFLTAAATLAGKTVLMDGDDRMRERPMRKLIQALTDLGAEIESENGKLPIKIKSIKPTGGKIKIPGNISSQYISAILMIAPFLEKPTQIQVEQKLYSKAYVEMTLKIMKSFGVPEECISFSSNLKNLKIKPVKNLLVPKSYTIEPDASSASYIAAFTSLNPEKKVLLLNLYKNSIQGDIKFVSYLEKMGVQIKEQKEGLLIEGPTKLKPLKKVNMNNTPDLVMTFAILATQTEGKTRIENIENLRVKECDRLQTLETELKKLGVKVKTGKDFIEIEGKKDVPGNVFSGKTPRKILIKTYNDHRIAMAFALLDGISKNFNLQIENPSCVSKSYTTFWKDLSKLKSSFSPAKNLPKKNIILIGLRGSGKTTLGKKLAKKLNFNFIDTDEEIEKKEKIPTSEIIEKKGLPHFRKIEKQVITELSKQITTPNKTVISTGGGAILDAKNVKKLKKIGTPIYLQRSTQGCVNYIKKSKKYRPPLTKNTNLQKEMMQIYKERRPLYEKIADIKIKRTDNLSKDIKKILTKLSNPNS